MVGAANIGEIHSLYQDLFLTDIKREVEHAQTELKACKQEQNTAQREMALLKRENQQLNATLKRYRKQLQEMQNPPSQNAAAAKDLLNQLISPTQTQKVVMSLEGAGAVDPSQLGKKLKRSESGTSSITQAVTVTNVGNQS